MGAAARRWAWRLQWRRSLARTRPNLLGKALTRPTLLAWARRQIGRRRGCQMTRTARGQSRPGGFRCLKGLLRRTARSVCVGPLAAACVFGRCTGPRLGSALEAFIDRFDSSAAEPGTALVHDASPLLGHCRARWPAVNTAGPKTAPYRNRSIDIATSGRSHIDEAGGLDVLGRAFGGAE
jgi:hypothetical protein